MYGKWKTVGAGKVIYLHLSIRSTILYIKAYNNDEMSGSGRGIFKREQMLLLACNNISPRPLLWY